jgi:hypothetical protein
MILLILTEMKKFIITSILTVLVAAGTTTVAQNYPDEYLGLPGDNLNLYAVLNLFQKSETLEGFERTLNDENSRINNLDLNGDKMVDYIIVKDYIDGNVHNIVLRVALNRNEYQDVAVFTVQRFRNGSVEIQLIGDEALYGKNYIIEPIYADNYGETPNPGYSGSTVYRNNITVVRTSAFEIALWPLIRFIYMPNYVIWNSSWYWGYYPSYWHPWRPYYWHYYYGYHYHWFPQYYSHYHHWNQNRYPHYNDFYYNNIRSHSPYVSARIKEGHYKSTYSHPEQRRDGENLYSKSINNSVNRVVSKPEKDQNASTSRRTLNNYSERAVTESAQNQHAGTSRKSTPNDSYRTVERHEQANNAGSSRRSPSTVSDRAYSRPQQYQKAQPAGKSKQSTVNAGSSDRRSTKVSKPGSVYARSDNAKGSAANKTPRRK